MDHYPTYDTDTDLGDRPPTPTQQRQVRFKLKPEENLYESNQSTIPVEGRQRL